MLFKEYQLSSYSDNNVLYTFLLTQKTNIQMYSYWNDVLHVALEVSPKQG